jgi:hypothetical protein
MGFNFFCPNMRTSARPLIASCKRPYIYHIFMILYYTGIGVIIDQDQENQDHTISNHNAVACYVYICMYVYIRVMMYVHMIHDCMHILYIPTVCMYIIHTVHTQKNNPNMYVWYGTVRHSEYPTFYQYVYIPH